MSNIKQNCIKISQIVLAVNFLCISAFAQSDNVVSRKPANFVPDEDMIVVPLIVERDFIEEFHNAHKGNFTAAKKKIDYWRSQEQYAKDYGLEDAQWIHLPSADEKFRFFERNYMRFLKKDLERSTNKGVQDTVSSWTADDELDSIQAAEYQDKVIVHAKRKSGKKIIIKSKTVKVGKRTLKFDIQPRLEIGMIKIRLKAEYFELRAWLGANGDQEINLKTGIKSTGTRALVNYYVDDTRLLAAVDQTLKKNWSLRITHQKDFTDINKFNDTIVSETNRIQVRFGATF